MNYVCEVLGERYSVESDNKEDAVNQAVAMHWPSMDGYETGDSVKVYILDDNLNREEFLVIIDGYN